MAPPNWSEFDDGNLGDVGIWNPLATSDYDSIPDGDQVAQVYFAGAAPGVAFGLSQVLGVAFAAATDYELSVQVGRSKGFDWPNYRVELWAGSVLLASDDNTVSPVAGGWALSTVTYDHASGPAATPGDDLEIRLLSRGEDPETGVTGQWSVEFDAVPITVTTP